LRSRLHTQKERAMAEAFSLETLELLDAADRVIARSRDLAEQRKQTMAECERTRRRQEIRLAFLREIKKPK
jgi:hypothetical protein